MAKFANNTLTQVAGFDGQILAQELIYNQKDFWNMTWNNNTDGVVTPIDISGVTISAQIIRRTISDLTDGRYGLEFNISDYPPYLVGYTRYTTYGTVRITNTNEGSNTALLAFDSWSPDTFQVGDMIRFYGGTGFGGLNVDTNYYIVYKSFDYGSSMLLKFSLTKDGPPIELTSAGGYLQMETALYGPLPIDLVVTNRNDTSGKYTLVIDDSAWDVMATDPELSIEVNNPVCFSGRIKLSFPSVGTQPAYDEQVFLLFLIRSDGVVN